MNSVCAYPGQSNGFFSNVLNEVNNANEVADDNINFNIEDVLSFGEDNSGDEEVLTTDLASNPQTNESLSAKNERVSESEIISGLPPSSFLKERTINNLVSDLNLNNMFLESDFIYSSNHPSNTVKYIKDFATDEFLDKIVDYEQQFSHMDNIYSKESTDTTLCSPGDDIFSKAQFPIDDTMLFESDIQIFDQHVAISDEEINFQESEEIKVDQDEQEFEGKQASEPVESENDVKDNFHSNNYSNSNLKNEDSGDENSVDEDTEDSINEGDSDEDANFELDDSDSDEDNKSENCSPVPKIKRTKSPPRKVGSPTISSKRVASKTVPLRRFGSKTVPYTVAPNTTTSNKFGYKTVPPETVPPETVSSNNYRYKSLGSKSNKFVYKTIPSTTITDTKIDEDISNNDIVEIQTTAQIEEKKETKLQLIKKVKNHKRQLPPFIIDDKFFSRLSSYWVTIYNGAFYQNLINKFSEYLSKNDITLLDPELYKNGLLVTLLPNYATLEFFNKYQGIGGWTYEINPDCKNIKPAMRWTGQSLNFYDFYISRYKKGVKQSKQALCPYCPLNESTNLDDIFHTTHNSHYSHHLGNNHGVYSVGYEMLPPIIGMKNGVTVALCPDCNETLKVSLNKDPNLPKSILTAYFRHNYKIHNKPKGGRSEKQIIIDNAFFNSDKSKLIYEKFNF